ncbi:MAG: hypothetical protein IT579_01815 [Verrucomicrobia subdivision 3 bacterium]|nr:hypothetical protein [Limisphaerales bacterium]
MEGRRARTGDILCHSSVFVAPPNHHLLVAKGGRLKLSSASAAKFHFARPSAEPLFASVAKAYTAVRAAHRLSLNRAIPNPPN